MTEYESSIHMDEAEDKAIDYVFKLLDIPWWCYAIATLLGVTAWRVWKKSSLGLLIGYVFLILAETVLIRKPFVGEHIKLELLWSWRVWAVQRSQIIANVIMFVPVGVLVGWIWRWRGLWVAAGLSVLIEVLQLITARGLCEFDDVIHMADDPTIGFMVDKYYKVPEATNEKYVDVLLDICRKENVDIYFPNISAEVSAVAERVSEFSQIGTKVSIADQSVVDLVNNKLHAYDYFKKFGLALPNYYPVHTISDFENGCKQLGYPEKPVCLKLVSNSGSRGVRIIDASRDRYQIFAHEKPNSFFTSYEDTFTERPRWTS